jgi:hypothetical protein
LSRRRNPLHEPKQSEIDELLAAMDAAELRQVVHDVLLELLTVDGDGPRRAAPEAADIVRQAGIEGMDGQTRAAVLATMRKAAERRVAGVTGQKRRGHYGHAAELVALCLEYDQSPEAARWAATVRQEYRRYPALRAELEGRLGPS